MTSNPTWRGMGEARIAHDVQDTPHEDDNDSFTHTGSVINPVTKDHAYRWMEVKSVLLGNSRKLVVGTWNIRTLTADGKLKELNHEMDQYRWNILGISELCWKGFGDTSTNVAHKLYFSSKKDKHKHSVGFLVHKDILDTVVGCWPVSNRPITIEEQPHSTSPSFRPMPQHQRMRTARWKTSTSNYKQPYSKRQRRILLSYKKTGM